jgi:hypothetical protein
MKKTYPKIPLLTAAIFFVLCAVALVFFYRIISDNNQRTQEGRTAWQIEKQRRDDIRTLDRSLLKIAPQRAELDTHFAKSSDVVPFLDTIEKLAPMAGAKAEVISVDTLPSNTGLVVGLKAVGSFTSVYKFLELLENSPYELNFISMNIDKVDTVNKKGGNWEAIFKIQLLSFTE